MAAPATSGSNGIAAPPGIAAPGLAETTTAPAADAVSAHHDIARDIGQQVESMILKAKRRSETMVGAEIHKIKQKMESMSEKIRIITERLDRVDPSSAILKADLQESIVKLEEVWESEVGVLKYELWQTIQAHNHNADLMKHHKDAIDEIQARMAENTPNPELQHAHQQLMQVDKLMQREQTKQHQIDQFMQRLTVVQQQLNAGLGGWGSVPSASVPFSMPSAGAAARPPAAAAAAAGNLHAAAVASALAASAAASKKAPKKSAKSAKAPAAAKAPGPSAFANSLRAEAPEFVPTAPPGWEEN
eukprot:TRINITY_DN15412_c0_g3_i1.p1 TRINITY_DN15412_c0_g3~~TRINITY_DN15412_c0_g3_i1.p1  ORF type:complete len:303 (+),score=79.21 TRINITY_DN15412_c0_g3_i1:126-1034(+)